jgi:hypothetical protein
MDLTTLERYVLDEWIFIPVMLLISVWAFGLGFITGMIIAHI